MNSKIVLSARKELKKNSSQDFKKSGERFFKDRVKIYGVKSVVVRKIAKKYFQEIKNFSKKEIFEIAAEFLKSDYNEEAFIAFYFIYQQNKKYEPPDFKIFCRWIEKYINNWAKCDTFCNHSIGAFIEKFPGYIENLKVLAKSKNRWLRRAAAVSLIIPAKKGEFLKDILEICGILLKDKEDMVQKGYGWLLKDASKVYQKEIFDYVMKNKKEMPRTALRYAIERLPENLRKLALEK